MLKELLLNSVVDISLPTDQLPIDLNGAEGELVSKRSVGALEEQSFRYLQHGLRCPHFFILRLFQLPL